MKTDAKEKKCLICKRIIVGESKLGLCPDCFNKVGTGVSVFVAIGGTVLELLANKKIGPRSKS